MLKTTVYLMAAVLLLGGGLAAKDGEDRVTQALAEYEEWMKVLVDFTQGVEFDENDIRQVIEYWPEMDELEVMRQDNDTESAGQFAKDVREILSDPEYVAWARTRGLDPEGWLRTSMRVSTVYMMQQMEAQREMMAAQRESYEAMVEQSCAQVDEKTCQQMRQSMAQSTAMSEAIMESIKALRPPTSGELALLEGYGPELESVMSDDDEDEYGDYEYYEEDGG